MENFKQTFDLSKLIEIKLKKEDSFLVIKETLTRIGIASRKDRKLYQTAHILHKQGKYYIVHFKYLFALDGREYDISNEDIKRQNTIALLLEEWDLLEVLNKEIETSSVTSFKILSHTEKDEWELCPKYKIGVRKLNY